MAQDIKKIVWIGMVQVKPKPGSETLVGNVEGAFVNVLTWAANSSEFRDKAKELMDDLTLEVVGVEDEEPLSERKKRGDHLDPDVAQVASEVETNPEAIRYMTFHTWPGEAR